MRHPFQLVATPPGQKPIYADIPQVCTDAAYAEAYPLIGVYRCSFSNK
jgi:hypothetical protein